VTRRDIFVSGSQRRDYLTLIRFFLVDIHSGFEHLNVTEKLSLPDNPDI
jgi:hypothetical protein